MTLLERIQTADDDAQVSILHRAGTRGAVRGGEDIFSVKELKKLMAAQPEKAAEGHKTDFMCDLGFCTAPGMRWADYNGLPNVTPKSDARCDYTARAILRR